MLLADSVARRAKRRNLVPVNKVSPGWLIAEIGRKDTKRDCAVNFSTLGRDSRG